MLEFIKKNLFALVLVLVLLLTTIVLAIQTPLKTFLFKPKAANGQLAKLAFNLNFTAESKSVAQGTAFTLPIYLNTDAGNIVGTDVVIGYDSTKLIPISLTPDATTVSTTTLNTFAPVNPTTGSFLPDLTKNPLEFGAVTFNWSTSSVTAPFTGIALLANLTFQVKPTATGSTNVTFIMTPGSTADSNIVSTSNPPTDFLTQASQISNATVTITTSTITPTLAQVTATPTRTPTPTLTQPSSTPTPTQVSQNIAPWITSDVGTPALSGSASLSNGAFTLTGAGTDIWNTSDQFRFVYQPVVQNFTITAKVNSLTNTNPWSKAGVMIRETLDADSPHAMMIVTPGSNLSAMQYRQTKAGITSHVPSTPTLPFWVRMSRASTSLIASTSPDGQTWTTVGSATISMTQSVFAGFVLTSHNPSQLATATYSNVSLQSTPASTIIPTLVPTITPTLPPSTSTLTFILNFEGAVANSGKSKVLQISYGTTTTSVTVTPLTGSSNHTGTLTGLTPNQPYTFRLKGPQHLGKLIPVSPLASGPNSLNWSSTPLKTGDITNDNIVNLSDYSSFLGQFAPAIQKDSTSDLNFDGFVDIHDYQLLVTNFNPTAPGQ